MNFRRILGMIILVIGILMMIFSISIKNRTEEGNQEVKSGQKKVDRTNKAFSLTPLTEPLGKGVTGSAQKQIDEGKEEIAYYQQMAKWLKTGGIIFIAAGVVTIIIPRKNKRHY